MLKAYIIREIGYEAVYYPDSDRTLSLPDCLKKVFTNENDPLRLNMEVVRRKLAKEGIVLVVKGEPKEFNTFHFGVFVDFYNMKGNDTYSYNLSLRDEQPSWGYSQQAIDLMLQEIRRAPKHVVDSMRTDLSKRNSLKDH